MKYTITSPETETRLATVDQTGDSWEVSRFDAKGAEAKERFDGAQVSVCHGQLIVAWPNGRREVHPIQARGADGVVVIATALGNVRLLVTRGVEAAGGAAGKSAHKSIKSSMPGKIFKLLCRVGDRVEPGQPLLIIEAMKMENEIRAPQAGVVEELAVQPGQKVETGELLVKLGTGA